MFLSTSSKLLINQSFHSATRHAHYVLTSVSRRFNSASTKAGNPNLSYVPHAFSFEDASKKIQAHDQNRWFAPIQINSNDLVVSDQSPLTAVFVPVCGIYADVASVYYKGEVGKHRHETHYYTDDKGHLKSTTRVVTDWYPVSGELGATQYRQSGSNMSIYFGGHYNDKSIEAAIERYSLLPFLQPFDKDKIDKKIVIDPWKKVDAYGIKEADRRIVSAEMLRAKAHMQSVYMWADEYHVAYVNVHYKSGHHSFGLKAMMLPVYILEYPRMPIRVLPAISSEDKTVIGYAPVSSVKVMTVTTMAATAISLLFPQTRIPIKFATLFGAAIASGALTNIKPFIGSFFEGRRVQNKQSESDQFSRTFIDNARLDATSSDSDASEKPSTQTGAQKLNIDIKYYEVLRLDPNKPVTSEIIKAAYLEKIKVAHPDRGDETGSSFKRST